VTGPLLAAAAARLAAAGIGSPRVDAELLLAHALGVPRSQLLFAAAPPPDVAARYETAVGRRAAREPLQHITGAAPFRHLEIAVGPGVFVPRPETELLVDAVLPVLGRPAEVAVDLCSGSGALALAIADESSVPRVLAVERPGPAFAWLRRNVAGTRVEAEEGDVRDRTLLDDLRGTVSAVVCNPPYVPAATDVAAEVRFDPDVAVFAGPDGLAIMPAVIARSAELLRRGGVLALEHDDTQGAAVPALLAADGRWTDIADHHDLTGRPRYATATRR
jgi:release factor glutamine methyltransferase